MGNKERRENRQERTQLAKDIIMNSQNEEKGTNPADFFGQTSQAQPVEDTANIEKPLSVTPQEAREETVTVSKKQLDTLMERLQALEYAADKSRIARYQQSKVGPRQHTCKVSVIAGDPVVSWRMIKDEVVKDHRTGQWRENQVVQLKTLSGRELDMAYFDFAHVEKVDALIIGRKSENDENYVKIELGDGQQIEVNVLYVN